MSVRFSGLTRLEPGAGVSLSGHCQIYTYFMQSGLTTTQIPAQYWSFYSDIFFESPVLGVP